LTGRERVLAAIDLQEPDRVPIDLGGSFVSSLHWRAYEAVKARLGLKQPTIIATQRSQIPWLDEQFLQRFHIDTRAVICGDGTRKPARTLPNGDYVDEWEAVRRASDAEQYLVIDGPFDRDDVTIADLEQFDWPDGNDPGVTEGLTERATQLRAQTDCAVVVTLPTPVFHLAQFMRGYDRWLMDSLLDERFFTALLTRLTDIWLQRADRILEAVGSLADVVMLGDDIAIQSGPVMSLDMYRRLMKPHHARIFAFLRAHTNARLMFHTCGNCYSQIPDLIEMGVQALNPIQVSAAELGDTARLKREFGKDLCFWGAIDTQHVLPHGTPEEVRAEVRRRISDLAPGGGYILSAVHNIQKEVPADNILAMLEAAYQYGSL